MLNKLKVTEKAKSCRKVVEQTVDRVTSCHHNQMDDACAGEDRAYWYLTKTKVELN